MQYSTTFCNILQHPAANCKTLTWMQTLEWKGYLLDTQTAALKVPIYKDQFRIFPSTVTIKCNPSKFYRIWIISLCRDRSFSHSSLWVRSGPSLVSFLILFILKSWSFHFLLYLIEYMAGITWHESISLTRDMPPSLVSLVTWLISFRAHIHSILSAHGWCEVTFPQVEAMQARHGLVCLKRQLSKTDESKSLSVNNAGSLHISDIIWAR